MAREINSLREWAQFSLFITSYLPLFILIVAKQFSSNIEYLKWGGISWKSLNIFGTRFGLSLLLIIVGIIGILGLIVTLKNVTRKIKNGFPVNIKDIKNKNSESISYIATYIIPFAFQNFNTWFDLVAIVFLIVIIYRIYTHTSLLLINPFLNIWYGLYEVEYEEVGKVRNGLLLSREKMLQEEDRIKLYEIGHKLYFSIKDE